MFGNKAARIKELEDWNRVIEEEKCRLHRENVELRYENDRLTEEIAALKEELAKIKPVIETSGFKPAVTDKCRNCMYACFSDYDPDELLGCCKDVVCPHFKSWREEK